MSNKIKIIIQELYELDPDLRQYENELEKLLSEMFRVSPTIIVDEKFRQELRAKLIVRSRELAANKGFSFPGFFFSFPFPLAIGAVAVFVLLVPLAIYMFKEKSGQPGNIFQPTVSQVDEKAFGPLASAQAPVLGFGGGGGGDVRSQGGGGSGTAEAMMTAPSAPTDSYSPLIYPEFIQYKFVYRGDKFSIDSDRMPVYRKEKNTSLAGSLAELLGNFKFGTFSFDTLQNTIVSQLVLTENRDQGYMVFINLDENNFSFGMNWEKWPNVYQEGETVPNLSDQEVIAIADSFLRAYGLDLPSYGSGKVSRPEIRIMSSEPGISPYQPQDLSVIYPLLIEDKPVVNQGGYENGLYVNVNLRLRKVTGAGNFELPAFQSSLYEVEIDTAKLISLAEKGGVYGTYPQPPATKTVEIQLGTPVLGLTRLWQNLEAERKSQELFVPALIFPILNKDTGFYQNHVVIPLAKEIIDQQNIPDGKPVPLPMPVKEE